MRKYIALVTILMYSSLTAQTDTIIDNRDGQLYATVAIGNLLWFQQNLNYRTKNSECYQNDTIDCGNWGLLYNKQEAQTACPKGWRLPTTKDWETLDTLDIFTLLDTVYWKNNIRHSNTTGLSLQPSGIKHKRHFWNQFINSTIWFDDQEDESANWHLHVHGDNGTDTTHIFHTHEEHIDVRKFAIRCVCDKHK